MNFAGDSPKSSPSLIVCADRVRPARNEQGWALVSVLWVVTMLAMMAIATQGLLVTSARFAQRDLERAEASATLDAALARAILGICDLRVEQRWRVDGTAANFKFNDRVVRVRVQDQIGLIDLNAADGSMIERLLQSAGLTGDDAATMTDRILDWRSQVSPGGDANLKRLHGASDADYAAAGRPYHPRHGPFQTISELQLVLGMTPTLFARLEPAVTVYSNRPAIDPNVAPEAALRALHLGAPEEISTLLRARHGVARDDTQVNTFSGVLNPAVTVAGHTFAISAELMEGEKTYTRNVVIALTGDERRPYIVLAWQ